MLSLLLFLAGVLVFAAVAAWILTRLGETLQLQGQLDEPDAPVFITEGKARLDAPESGGQLVASQPHVA